MDTPLAVGTISSESVSRQVAHVNGGGINPVELSLEISVAHGALFGSAV